MTEPRLRCKAVRSPRGARETVVEWGDGHVSRYPHAILRGYCPCAGCQGHGSDIQFVETTDFQQEIDRIEPVGNYALQITWFDGHGTGLYTYRYLRELCGCEACRAARAEHTHPGGEGAVREGVSRGTR
jgi:DUF971 family protein